MPRSQLIIRLLCMNVKHPWSGMCRRGFRRGWQRDQEWLRRWRDPCQCRVYLRCAHLPRARQGAPAAKRYRPRAV